jgi:hypothetical protein
MEAVETVLEITGNFRAQFGICILQTETTASSETNYFLPGLGPIAIAELVFNVGRIASTICCSSTDQLIQGIRRRSCIVKSKTLEQNSWGEKIWILRRWNKEAFAPLKAEHCDE